MSKKSKNSSSDNTQHIKDVTPQQLIDNNPLEDPTENVSENTDREIYREVPGDYYSPSLHVTNDGKIGIDAGGLVFEKSVREWHNLARDNEFIIEGERCECENCEEIRDFENNICEDCITCELSTALEAAKEKAKQSEASPSSTKRRILMEELKSTVSNSAETIGESNTILVEYVYGRNESATDFREVASPTSVRIKDDRSYGFSANESNKFSKLQLKAHIQNLQEILKTLG